MRSNKIAAIIGLQWGDEGKGKLVDILTEKYDVIVRSTGGANAGHTIYREAKKIVFHLIPSGMMHKDKICIIGNGVVAHLPTLIEELNTLKSLGAKIAGRLFISDRAHIVFDFHKIIDGMQEEKKGGSNVGTTRRGIGPAYTDKISRIGIRMGELRNFESFSKRFMENVRMARVMYGNFEYDENHELNYLKSIMPEILPLIINTEHYLHEAYKKGKSILIEGANGTMLDIDHGTYPFVTSSNASIGGAIAGSGLPAQINPVIGILKAYTTRVGGGPFPTELHDETGKYLREKGGEFGSTTGRPRRCGWFDAVVARWTCVINGATEINLTKLDVLSGLKKIRIATAYELDGKKLDSLPYSTEDFARITPIYEEMEGWDEDISKCAHFKDLPPAAQKYIKKIEKLLGCPIKYIGTGTGAKDLIKM
ncbi:adenylosuccinate synthase [Candidatus Peregrinibacteria bacterium]|nr:adenylosuccinate synthase [Candidatus Peregrinibacteria bacterium]